MQTAKWKGTCRLSLQNTRAQKGQVFCLPRLGTSSMQQLKVYTAESTLGSWRLVSVGCLLSGWLTSWECSCFPFPSLSLSSQMQHQRWKSLTWHPPPPYQGQSRRTRSTLSQPASCAIMVFGWRCRTEAEIHQVLVNRPWVTTAGWPEENDYEIKLFCLSNKDYWYAGQHGSQRG